MELIRNLLSELLLYPLVVCDLFELIVNETYLFRTANERVSFSYFIIGLFFLVVSVYIARMLIVIMALRTLWRVPQDFTKTGNETVKVIMRFLFHVILQLLVHVMCIIAVAAKITQEYNGLNVIHISPMLWVVLFTGWLIPLMGTIAFFPVNYYWIEQFSIGMYMNIVGLLQEKSFAEAVFTKKKITDVKEACDKFFKKIKYLDLQQQVQERSAIGTPHRFFYPLRTPVFYFITPVYFLMLAGFFICLILTVDLDGVVQLSVFEQGSTGVAIVLCIIVTVMANYQFLLLVSVLLLFAAVIAVLLTLTLPIALLGAVTVLIPGLPILAYLIIERTRRNKVRTN